MPDEPRRRPRRLTRRTGQRRKQKKRLVSGHSLISPSGLDVRTLIILSLGDWWELGEYEEPPASVSRWLEQADRGQLRGILLETLQRWRELH